MIHEHRFLISRKPYAVKLDSLRREDQPSPQDRQQSYCGRIDAVWFRRRKGVTVACIGTLWDIQDNEPADGREFLKRHDDGCYGGHCEGRWDGNGYWGAEKLELQQRHLSILQPMLANYPVVPPGFDGWWTFQSAG
ncbi:hypothetical protein CTZ27_33155 [Streptomyces griseocarneus]|nr:hypothetical protein CTZ27_33155 [Streptomyces griseocarneus]